MNAIKYLIDYTIKLMVRRAVHRIVDGDDRPMVGRAKKEKYIRIDNRKPLSDAQQFSSKNDFPTLPKRSLWSEFTTAFKGAPKPAPMVDSPSKWTDSRNLLAATIIAMPITHTHEFAVRLNGTHILGRIDGQLSLTNLNRPLPDNDPRNISSKLG